MCFEGGIMYIRIRNLGIGVLQALQSLNTEVCLNAHSRR